MALTAPGHAEPALRLRVLTWNVWGLPGVSTNLEPRMAALPDAIAKLDPDIILLQELWIEADGVRVARGLARHGYPYASHLAHTASGMSGLFTASKLPLETLGFSPFASGRVGHSFWHLEWMASKGVGRFLVRTSRGEIEIQNTHLQAQYDTDGYAAERLAQASEIELLPRDSARPLVLGGDFNTGAEELPRQVLCDLDALTDAIPSPEPDTIYVRNGVATQVRVVTVRRALTEPVRLENGVTAVLSDHPAVVADLELSDCTGCAPSALANTGTREATRSALVAAAATTPWRVTVTLAIAAGVLGAAASLRRRTRVRPDHSWRFRMFRRLALGLLAVGFVWSAYLGTLYYPARAKALRLVVHELEAQGPAAVLVRQGVGPVTKTP